MKIRFTQDTTVDVITEVCGDEIIDKDTETFLEGDQVEVDVISMEDGVTQFLLGDNGITFLSNDCWESVV